MFVVDVVAVVCDIIVVVATVIVIAIVVIVFLLSMQKIINNHFKQPKHNPDNEVGVVFMSEHFAFTGSYLGLEAEPLAYLLFVAVVVYCC